MLPSSVKRSIRSVVDRTALPYVDLVVSRLQGGVVAEPGDEVMVVEAAAGSDFVPSDYFHNLLHTLRTMSLRTIPKDVDRVLSIGASGRWYFDWFEQNVGPVSEHIGLEAFEAKPDDLPGYATWIANTADQMVDVPTASIDLAFAGQTVEHLWAHELVGFLAEAHRVIRPGRYLVVDSPNRLVTEHLHWSHGGHTIEISAGEMTELLDLAGFEVLDVAGLWSCVLDGEVVALEHRLAEPNVLVERIVHGHEHPDDCFVWWINARRLDREPDLERLRTRVDELFAANWDVRMSRGLYPTTGADRLPIKARSGGALGSTLPFPLREGPVRVAVSLAEGSWSTTSGFRVRLLAPGGLVVQELRFEDAKRDGERLEWTFEQPWLLFAIVLELSADLVAADVAVELPLTVAFGG